MLCVLMAVKIRNRHRLKSKDIQMFQLQIEHQFSQTFFTEQDTIEVGRLDSYDILLVNGEISFMLRDGHIFFTLKGLYKYNPTHKCVLVDMGAVPFVINGADIMAAGIVDADATVQPGDQVWIGDQTHKKPLAVGRALVDGDTMIQQSTGKAVENLHYIGDKLWELIK
jgi:PUA domain protein